MRFLEVFALMLLPTSLVPRVSGGTPLVTAGPFAKIYDASIGEARPWYINDHCFILAPDGRWHLFGITHEEPAKPAAERVLAHATAKSLLHGPWEKHPPALVYAPEPPWNEAHLWAPYVLFHAGTYYMFYCAGDADHTHYKIQLARSQDLWNWTRDPRNPMVVDGFDARDPFVLRVGDRWVMYYTATSRQTGGNHIVAAVTSRDLVTWGERRVVFTDEAQGTRGGGTESPFVVRRGTRYYLFIGPRGGYVGTDVFVSDDPFHWTLGSLVGHIPAHAAEIVRDVDGAWYASAGGWGQGGVYLARLKWHDGLDNADTSMPIPMISAKP